MMILSFNTSCTIESYVTKKNAADEEIQLYINNNDINLKPNSSGLVFIPIKKGNGIYPKDGDKVAFHYTGYYLNGDVYFKIHREGQNLDRARTQFKLVADMEAQMDEMQAIVDKYYKMANMK